MASKLALGVSRLHYHCWQLCRNVDEHSCDRCTAQLIGIAASAVRYTMKCYGIPVTLEDIELGNEDRGVVHV